MIDPIEHPIAVASLLLSLPFFYRRITSRQGPSALPLPPGPRGYPLIGNILDIGNNDKPWENYSRIAKEYGDIVFLEALGTKVLVLSSVKRAMELLEGRSSVYSDRPHLPMLHGQMKFDLYFANMRYGPMWRRQRKAFHQHFNAAVVSRHNPIVTREGIRLLQELAVSPGKFDQHLGSFFTRAIVKTTYGFDIEDDRNPISVMGAQVMEGFTIAGVPGTFLIDLIPALKHLPSWMPGTGWRSFAEYYRNVSAKARREPFERVLIEYKEGRAVPCIATKMIEELPPLGDPRREEEEIVARDTLGVAYIAAYDTSLAAGRTFVLLMAMYPEIQRKAQAEIDAVVGTGQIPTFKDRSKLVYMDALLREVFRWHRETPLGLPHATSEDDIYDGYFIPKGTIVIANSWHILSDPEHYTNPSEFNPDRHIKNGQIDKDVFDPYAAAFGFGRRICPGRHMALDMLYLMAASILAGFNISARKDEAGNLTLKSSFDTTGLVVSPEPFECDITLRSAGHAQMIHGLDAS